MGLGPTEPPQPPPRTDMPGRDAVLVVLAETHQFREGNPLTIWETTCGRCLSTGVIENPDWAEWWAEDDRRKAEWAHQTDGPDRSGWMASAAHLAHEAQGMPGGDEEIPCPVCNGARTVPTAAGDALLRFLRKHLH